jgi:hypothetical protein
MPTSGTDSLRLDYELDSSTLSAVEVLVYNTHWGTWERIGTIGDIGISGTKFVRIPLTDASSYVGPAGDVTVRILAPDGGGDLTNPVFDLAVNPDGDQ